MFGLFKREKIHEPIALGALVAASMTLHSVWITNLLMDRSDSIFLLFTLSNRIGPVTGIYFFAALVYATVFGATTLWFRGKDCRAFRDRAFWFFMVSITAYTIMTIPAVYTFEIMPPPM